jgi:hypothetical protein
MDSEVPKSAQSTRDSIDPANMPEGSFDQWPVDIQLQYIHQMMREVSRPSEPQKLVRMLCSTEAFLATDLLG